MISVAMCTYNGSQFLTRQLESIARQTLPVDELIVCDDGSTDNTLDILNHFSESAPFRMEIHRNEHNLGSTRNFEKCLGRCRGDILFLCDQDDLWNPDKTVRQTAYFGQHPRMDAVFSNAAIIDANDRPTGKLIWDLVHFSPDDQRRWQEGKAHELLFDSFIVTGATLAIRRRALPGLLPFPVHLDRYIHDAWIALALSVQGAIGFIPEPLISYRIHATQQVGFGATTAPVSLKDRVSRSRTEKLVPLQHKATLLQHLYTALETIAGTDPRKLQPLARRQKHFETRATLPANHLLRIIPVGREWVAGNYRFSSPHWWLPLLGDLFE